MSFSLQFPFTLSLILSFSPHPFITHQPFVWFHQTYCFIPLFLSTPCNLLISPSLSLRFSSNPSHPAPLFKVNLFIRSVFFPLRHHAHPGSSFPLFPSSRSLACYERLTCTITPLRHVNLKWD